MVTVIAEGPRGKRIAGVSPSVEEAKKAVEAFKKALAYKDCAFFIDNGKSIIPVEN